MHTPIESGNSNVKRQEKGQQAEEVKRAEVIRYLAILAVWFAAWLLPQYAGAWYWPHFNLYQAMIPLFLLFAVFKLTREWWRTELGCVLVLQILLNVGDAMMDFPALNYDRIQASLNLIEIAIILGFGLPTLLIRKFGKHERTSDHDHPDNCAHSIAPGLQRNGNHG